jgi:hypothetical protein
MIDWGDSLMSDGGGSGGRVNVDHSILFSLNFIWPGALNPSYFIPSQQPGNPVQRKRKRKRQFFLLSLQCNPDQSKPPGLNHFQNVNQSKPNRPPSNPTRFSSSSSGGSPRPFDLIGGPCPAVAETQRPAAVLEKGTGLLNLRRLQGTRKTGAPSPASYPPCILEKICCF